MEIFGTSDQQRMLRKGENLLALLANDPCFCSYWRAVLLSDYTAGQATVEILIHLTRLQGVSGCEMVPDAAAPVLMQALIERNLKVDSYVNFIGGKESIEIARATLAKGGLAPDLSLQIIDETSPPSLLEAFAEVALAEEVLPSAGSVMRGIARPGFGTVAFDTYARPVATAAGALSRHRGHPDHDMAQWGQLATWNDRKGQGVARAMAALSLVHGWDHMEMRRFSTGIRAGNAPSEGLCRSLGLRPSGYTIVISIDPESFTGDRTTK